MKRHEIQFHPARVYGPMSYWVHRAPAGKVWAYSKVFDPPMEPGVPGKGFPLILVTYGDFTFVFASRAELATAIDVLGRKVLPTTLQLTEARYDQAVEGRIGPNQHWLSRLPGEVLPWRYREPAVKYLRRALVEFNKMLTKPAPASPTRVKVSRNRS
jgi:hypothetical protein